MTLDPVLDLTSRVALGLLLLSSAVHKVRARDAFRATLEDYRLLPMRLSAVAAVGIPVAELVLGAALFAGPLRSAVLLGTALLLTLYTLAIGINLARGRRHIDCGCSLGPAGRQPLSEWLIVRNVLLVGLTLACRLPVGARPLVWVDFITVAGGVAVLVALYVSAGQLIANSPGLARLRGDV